MVVLIVLLNLLGAVSLCKAFFLQIITFFGIYLYCSIRWPFTGVDQPAAAAHSTMNLNVAFELVQVRTGHDH